MRRSEHDRPSGTLRRAGPLTLVLLTIGSVIGAAQPASLPFTLRATTTVSGKAFPNPLSPSTIVRNDYVTVSDWYGVAAELLIPLTQEFSVTTSVEVLWHLDEGNRPIALGGTLQTLPVRDGYLIVPLEVGVGIGIPISDETYRMTMSGGLCATFMNRIQEIAGVRAQNEGLPVAYGLFVGVSFEFRLMPGLFGHVSTRFRDPEANITTRYTQSTAEVDGRTIALPTEPMTTRLNVDGLSLSAGVMVDLHRLF